MAKFNVPDPNDDVPVKPAMDEVRVMNSLPPTPPATIQQPPSAPQYTPPPPVAAIPVMGIGDQQTNFAMQQSTAQAQANVGLAQARIDDKVVDQQIKKEEEHWMKSYWRPAMGWLYMIICFCDFILFPAITMFMPVIAKGFGITMNYVAWQSLSLSNGGLMHLAFGAILGVSAWTRGQEKLAKI